MATPIAPNSSIFLSVSLFLVALTSTASAQSSCVCPEAATGVSVPVLVGACLAVLGGTILLELVGYLAYQKWKKKERIKDGDESPPEPSVAYSSSTAIDIGDEDAVSPPPPVDVVRRKEPGRSGSDSGRSSVYSISETQSMRSFFGDSAHGSRCNSIIDVANDYGPLTDTYRIDWKDAAPIDGDALPDDDYDVLERAFPILPPKLDAVDFTQARYKSTKIDIIPPEPQEVVVGVAVEGDRTSRSSSSTRIFRSSTHGRRSRQQQQQSSANQRNEERGAGGRHENHSWGRYPSSAVEIEPDRPSVARPGRIEIDENFSIANSRRSESSDEDLYDYGDGDRRGGSQRRTGSVHDDRRGGEQRVKRVEKREAHRRQVVEKRGSSLEGSAAMKASGARRAKSMVEGGGERTHSRSTHQARSAGRVVGTSGGRDYQMVKREVVDGKEVVTLVSAEPPSRDYGRTAATRTSELARSYSEMDPRQRVSFRDPLESLDEQSIPTIGVIHLVDSMDEGSSSDISYRRAPRGRATDRFQKKRPKRSRSESPIKYSEREAEESRRSQQSATSSWSSQSSKSATSSERNHRNTNGGLPTDVPTIGIVRLVSSSPNLDNDINGSTWPRANGTRSLPNGSVSHYQKDEISALSRTGRSDRGQSRRRTVDVSTQCDGPKTRTVGVEPRVSWKRLLDEMEIIMTNGSDSAKHRSVGGRMRSTLSRLTNNKKERNDRSLRDIQRRHSIERDGYKDEVTWEELLRDVDDVDDRLDSDDKRRSRSGPRSQVSSRGHTSKKTTRTARSSSRGGEAHHRSRSMSPTRHYSHGYSETVQEEERRGRSSVRRPRDETDHPQGQVSRGTQPDVSWGTLMRLMESRMEEKMTMERRYKKRAAPVVGKFSLKAEKRPKAPVADMGTSPELSWGDFIEIATAEAERNMKSRSVPDLRVADGPQNIGMFSLKEKKRASAPVRSTGTETDLSYTDLVDIITEELNLIDSERSSSRRSASHDRERILDRTRSLGVVHLRSRSEERPRGRDSGTQPDLSWTQIIDIVKEETRRMILKQSRDNASDMGTNPAMSWNELVETILEESEDFWRHRKQMVDKGTKPNRSWSRIVQLIQEETEEILRSKALNNMDSEGTQTEKDSSSVAVSTLRTWVRDRPRRVQWTESTEPQTEWKSLVREIEATAVSEYIKENGLDHPREAPVVSVIKLKKDEQQKMRTADSSTSPMVDWKSVVTEIQEDAIEQTRRIIKKEREQQQRIPVAGVFKLKQEEQPTTELIDTGTHPMEDWTDIITELEEEYENEYRRTIRELQHKVVELEELPKSFSVVNTGTQPDLSWDVIVDRIQEETEENIFHHQRIKQLEHLDSMFDASAQTLFEKRDASSQVAVMVHDKSSEAWQQIDDVGVQAEVETTEAAISFDQSSRDIGVDAITSRVESVGVACAPTTTDRHVAVTEQEKEFTSFGTQASSTGVSFGTVTEQIESSSTSSQCQVAVKAASVETSQDTSNQTQQTSLETSEQSLMTEVVAKDVRENGLQVVSDILVQSSQTEEMVTRDSSAMTDAVDTREKSTLAVQEETVVVIEEETTNEMPDPNIDTYETWTYLDDFRDEEEEPVLTSVFSHQFRGAQIQERSTLTAIETRSVNTETELAELERKHIQVSVESESKCVSHAPETHPMSTQTKEVITPAPLMAEKSTQQIRETSQFTQNTTTMQTDVGTQASPEERIYLHQASLVKPLTSTTSTECDAESDIDSGIDMDSQTSPVMVFSLDEYQQIERDMYEYQQMKKNVEEMEEELRQYKDTQRVITRLEREVHEYQRLKENIATMEDKIVAYRDEIYDYQQRQRGLEELKERLKEFEDQEIVDRVDAGIVTDILSSESQGVQTSDTAVRAWSSQTDIAVSDRSTSPAKMTVNDIPSQTDPRMTRDISTEVELIANHDQASQAASEVRDYAMATDKTEITNVALQATVTSHDTYSQYDRSEDDIGLQTNMVVTKSNEACQVTAQTNDSSTSTEIGMIGMSIQTSADVRETGAQYETSDTDMGSQTVSKQTSEVSTEVKAVRIEEKRESDAGSQTERVSVENRMVDSITRHINEAQVQVEQPRISLSFSVTQTVEKQLATSAAQTEEEVKAEIINVVTAPKKDVSHLVIQTEDVVTQSTSSQYEIVSTTSITQTEGSPIESRITQTEEIKQDTKDATTSSHPESTDFFAQTESVVMDSTSAQHDIDVISSLTQTEAEIRVGVEEKSTSIDVIQKVSCEQTDEAEWTSIDIQTEVLSTSDATSNTVSREIIDNSAQTHTDEVTTQVSQVQFSAQSTVGNTQTEEVSKDDSSCETEERVMTDQTTETEEVASSDIASQVASAMSDQHSQSEVQIQALEVQTEVIARDDSSTQYERSIMSDKATQYQASSDHYVLQTEDVRLASIQMNTDRSLSAQSATQTELETIAMKESSTQCEQSVPRDKETQYQARADQKAFQTLVRQNEFGMTCDLAEMVIEKEEEVIETIAPVTTSLFQCQVDQEETLQEDFGTTYTPPTAVTGQQVRPDTVAFGTSVAPSMTETGTLVDDRDQTDMGSQMTPVSEEKSTEVKSSSIQRAVSPITTTVVTASTQIDISPAPTSTVQIQVEDEEATRTVDITEETVCLSDVATQTRESSLHTMTQTSLRESRHAAVSSQQMERKVHTSMEARPVRNTRSTATVTAVRKEMGTQHIAREIEQKMHRRRDVTLSSKGTYTDVATRTSSTTQTIITRRANSGVQMVPKTAAVGVFSNMKPPTAIEGVNTEQKSVRSVPVQKDSPQVTSKPSQKEPAPITSRAVSPHAIEKLEDDIIDDMTTKLRSQIREEVETEYVSEILPILVEEALREKAEFAERSKPKSRDAITSPMRGRSMERSSQHSEPWPFTSTDAPESRRLGEREKHILRENTKRELRSELKPVVEQEIRKDVEREVRAKIARDVEQDVRHQVARDVEPSVRETVAENVKNDVIRTMKTDMRDSVKREVAAEVRSEVKREVTERIQVEVKHDLMREYRTEVFSREGDKIKKDITKTLKEELRPQLREEIEKELREDITRELRFENLRLVTSQKRVLVDKDTLTQVTKSKTSTTQVDPTTYSQGSQVREPKPEMSDKMSQSHQVVLERGTVTQKRPFTDFSTQMVPSVSHVGVNPTGRVSTTTFSAQKDQPKVEQKDQSDNYNYKPTGINEGTQWAVWNVTADSIVQAVAGKADKSVFTSLLFPSTTSKHSDLPDKKHQETQIHRTHGKSAEVQVSKDMSYTSASMQVQPDTKHASLGNGFTETYKDRATSPERKTTRDGSISPVTFPVEERTGRSFESSGMQTFGRSYASSSMQIQSDTKHASTSLGQSVRDVPIQMGPTATFRDRSISPQRSAKETSNKALQQAPRVRDGAISPVMLPNKDPTEKIVKSSQMQTSSNKSFNSSSMQFHPESRHASTGSKSAVQYTSTGLQATRSVREVPMQIGSNATFEDRSTRPEPAATRTSGRSVQFEPTTRDGSISPVMFSEQENHRSKHNAGVKRSAEVRTSARRTDASSSSIQFQPDTRHASIGPKSAVQHTSIGSQATRSVREVPIQMGSRSSYRDRSTSPQRSVRDVPVQMDPRATRDSSTDPGNANINNNNAATASKSSQYNPVTQDGSVSPIASRKTAKTAEMQTKSREYTSSSTQSHRETKAASASSRSVHFKPVMRDGSVSPVTSAIDQNSRRNVKTADSATSPHRSGNDVPTQVDPRTTRDSSTNPSRSSTCISSKSSQFYPDMKDGSVSPIVSRKVGKTAEMQTTEEKKYTSSSSQFQPDTKTASIGDAIETSNRSVQIEKVSRDGSISPVTLLSHHDRVPLKSVKVAEMQTKEKRYSSASSQIQAQSTTASFGYEAPAVNVRDGSISPVTLPLVDRAPPKSVKVAEMQTKGKRYSFASSQIQAQTTTASFGHEAPVANMRDGSISPVALPLVDRVPPKSVKVAEMQTKDKRYSSASSQIQAQTATASFGYEADAVDTSSKSMQSQPAVRDGSISPVASQKTMKAAEMQTKDKEYTSMSSQFRPDTKAASVGCKADVSGTSHRSVQFERSMQDGSISPVALPVEQAPSRSVKEAEMQTKGSRYTSASSQFHPDTKAASTSHKADMASTAAISVQFQQTLRDGAGSPVAPSADVGPREPMTTASSQFRPDTNNASFGYDATLSDTESRSMQIEPKLRDGASSPVSLRSSVKTSQMQTSRDPKQTYASSQFQPQTKTASVSYESEVANTKPTVRDGANSPVSLPVSLTSASSQFQPQTKAASTDYRAPAINTSQRSLQFEPTTRYGANSPAELPVDQRSVRTAELQISKESSYTSASSQSHFDTSHRSVQSKPETREGTISPIEYHPDPRSNNVAQMQTSRDHYSSTSLQFRPNTRTASVGYKTDVTNTSQSSVQFEPTKRDATNSPADLPTDRKSMKTVEMQTFKDRAYTSASSQFQPSSSEKLIQSKPAMQDGKVSPVEYPADQRAVNVAQMQTSRDHHSSTSSQFRPDTRTASVGYTADVAKTSQRSLQFEPTTRDGTHSAAELPTDRKSMKTVQMQTFKDRAYTSASSQFQPSSSEKVIQSKPVMQDGKVSPVEYPADPRAINVAQMQTSGDHHSSTSSQFRPDTRTASVGYTADVAKTSRRSLQFEPTTRDGTHSPAELPTDRKSMKTAEIQFRPTMQDGTNSPVEYPANPKSISAAQMQTSRDHFSSASSQVQPNTRTTSIGYKADVTDTSQRSFQFEPTMRDGTNSPAEIPVDQKSVRTAEMQTFGSNSHTSMQSKPAMRDGKNSPVEYPVDPRSVRYAQMQTSSNQRYSSVSSQFQPDTKNAYIGHGAIVTVSSLMSQPNTTTASFGPRLAVTSDRVVQIEPNVRDDGISPVVQPPPVIAPLGSPVLDQRRSLGTIDEEPVKLSKTTNLQRSSFVRTPQLDVELYNLLKQAEKLGTVRRMPSTSRTTVIGCAATTEVTPRVVDAVTTMLQQLPPRCRVVVLHQSSPGVTYTTALLTTTRDTPAMSTGFHQSRFSTSKTSTFPSIPGPIQGPIAGESDPERDDDSFHQLTSSGLQRTPSGRVRFADQDKHVGKQEIRTYRTYTKKTTTSPEHGDPIGAPYSTYGSRKPSPRNYPPSLAAKPGIEADVDTGDSETDSEPQLKSILRKPASQLSKGSTLPGKRAGSREDVSTESDESSASAGESSLAKLPPLSSLTRNKGATMQDLSVTGVIASSRSTTMLTGYRQYES